MSAASVRRRPARRPHPSSHILKRPPDAQATSHHGACPAGGFCCRPFFTRRRSASSVLALLLIAAGAWEWGRLNQLVAGAFDAGAVPCWPCSLSWWAVCSGSRCLCCGRMAGVLWVLAGGGLLRARRGGLAAHSQAAAPGGRLDRSGWPGWPSRRRAFWVLNFCCRSWCWCGWLTFRLILPVASSAERFSKGKLAPSISPGKSWEGVWGGMTGVVLLALAWRFLGGETLTACWPSVMALILMVLAVIFMAAMSVVGDLVESLVKRSAGAKDSSGLAARPRRRAGPHGRLAAHLAAGHDAGQFLGLYSMTFKSSASPSWVRPAPSASTPWT